MICIFFSSFFRQTKEMSLPTPKEHIVVTMVPLVIIITQPVQIKMGRIVQMVVLVVVLVAICMLAPILLGRTNLKRPLIFFQIHLAKLLSMLLELIFAINLLISVDSMYSFPPSLFLSSCSNLFVFFSGISGIHIYREKRKYLSKCYW